MTHALLARLMGFEQLDNFTLTDALKLLIGRRILSNMNMEYISLGKVEAALMSSNYVDNILLHAVPFHIYSVALVVTPHKALEKWANEAGIKYQDLSELCDKAVTVKEVQQSLSKVAKDAKLEKFEIPAKIKLLPEPWTIGYCCSQDKEGTTQVQVYRSIS